MFWGILNVQIIGKSISVNKVFYQIHSLKIKSAYQTSAFSFSVSGPMDDYHHYYPQFPE